MPNSSSSSVRSDSTAPSNSSPPGTARTDEDHPPPPHATRSYLACHSCRRRKTKCDGNTPCNHCKVTGKECSYKDRKKPDLSETSLKHKLKALEEKFERLSATRETSQLQKEGSEEKRSSGTRSNGKSPSPQYSDSATSNPSTNGHPSTSATTAPVLEVPTDVRDYLVRLATGAISRCNMEIDGEAFVKRLHLPSEQQPHPALVTAFMLLATYFSSPFMPIPPEAPSCDQLLQVIRHQLRESLSKVDRVLDFVAASTFLSWWFFEQGRFLEGQFEISSTVRLAINCGLHQIDEDQVKAVLSGRKPEEVDPRASPRKENGILGPLKDVTDLEFRVGIFWNIYVLDKNSVMMTGLPSAFDEFTEDVSTKITTVWPMHFKSLSSARWNFDDVTGFDGLYLPARSRNGAATQPPMLYLCAHAQAAALLSRTTALSTLPPQSSAEAEHIKRQIAVLPRVISAFSARLPPLRPEAVGGAAPSVPWNAFTMDVAFIMTALIKTFVCVSVVHMHRAAEMVASTAAEVAAAREERLVAAKKAIALAKQVADMLDDPAAKYGVCLMFGVSRILLYDGLGRRFDRNRSIVFVD
ncbi:hypothetical protein FRC02_011648 [Tulasnella sp. 418]|nr:hypothetical protein FRC02_011648 [Tulasnella sp. 418]